MRTAWIAMTVSLVALVVGIVFWLSIAPGSPDGDGSVPDGSLDVQSGRPLRIGLVPERDIFAQRKRYQALADHVSAEIQRPVILVTMNTYEGVLAEFAEHNVDGAFLGSMVAALSFDRLGTRVLVKPESPDGVSTYRGVIFVPEGSAIQSIADLGRHSIALVRATTAGDLFPIYLLSEQGLLDGASSPMRRWVGTHDEVILEVMDGRVHAGAVKDLRLLAFEQHHPQFKLRRLATSPPVPNNALVVAADMEATVADQLARILVSLDQTDEGRLTLAEFGAGRFVPCDIDEYSAIYDMVEAIGPGWDRLGVSGRPLVRPTIVTTP